MSLDKILDGRYSEFKGYRFDKVIFLSLVLLLLVSTVGLMFMNNFNGSQHPYFNCPNDYGRCFNPYFGDSNVCGKSIPSDNFLCTNEVVNAPYTYGEPTPWYVSSFGLIACALLLIAFVVNHFTSNKGFKI